MTDLELNALNVDKPTIAEEQEDSGVDVQCSVNDAGTSNPDDANESEEEALDREGRVAPLSDWEEFYDEKEGAPYWHNEATNTTTWDPPPGWQIPGTVDEDLEGDNGDLPVRINQAEDTAYLPGEASDFQVVAVQSEVMALPNTGEWHAQLFDCLEDDTCIGFASLSCCPCLAYGALYEELGQGDTITSALFWLMSCALCVVPRVCAEWNLRTSFRLKYGIPGSDCGDLGAVCCCECCALSQMVRHAKAQQLPPTPGNELWAVPTVHQVVPGP